MRDHGIEMEVAYFHDRSGSKEKLLAAGVPLWHVPPGRTRLITIWRLRRLIKDRKPDVIHTMVFEADIIGRTAAFLSRVPVISSIINEMYGPAQVSVARSVLKLRLGQLADIATARIVTHFHAISNTVADQMAPRLRIDRSDITVIYRGRDLEVLKADQEQRRSRTRRSLGFDDSTPIVLCLARHEPQKGLDSLVRSMPSIRDWDSRSQLLLAGRTGSVTLELRRLIEENALQRNVQILGQREDVADLLAASDVLALPSRWEGLGGVLIEAAAANRPIVCSELPVAREVLAAAGALSSTAFVAVDNVEQFSKTLISVLSAAGLPSEPTATLINRFSIDVVAGEHAALYRKAQQKRKVSPRGSKKPAESKR